MNQTDNTDLVSELFNDNIVSTASDESKKQWETICDCLEQMEWTGSHCPSPSPSPSNPVVISKPTSFVKCRKSDGDIHLMHPNISQQILNPPPQSAPIIFERGKEFNWNPENMISSHLNSRSIRNSDNTNQNISNFSNNQSPKIPSIYSPGYNQSSIVGDMFVNNQSHSNFVLKPVQTALNQTDKPLIDIPQSSSASTSFSNLVSTSNSFTSPSYIKNLYQIPTGENQRKQAIPINIPPNKEVSELVKASSFAQTSTKTPIPINKSLLTFSNENISYKEPNQLGFNRIQPQNTNRIEDEENGYTRVLLEHQQDRMKRLQNEFNLKKKHLKTLLLDIQQMEQVLSQRNLRYKPVSVLSSLQQEISKLREENRRLEVDCNCMYKRVDFYSRDGL